LTQALIADLTNDSVSLAELLDRPGPTEQIPDERYFKQSWSKAALGGLGRWELCLCPGNAMRGTACPSARRLRAVPWYL